MRTTLLLLSSLPALPATFAQRGAPRPPDPKVAQQVLQLERRWNEAIVSRDTAFISGLLAPDFLYTASDGSVNDKKTMLLAVSNPNSVVNPFQSQDVRVRQYGKNTVLLTGWFLQTGTWLGQPFALRLRFTDVFVKLNGRWQAVSAQAAVLPAARKS
ncbi:nuclear transport factor 2 family protein [Hymenobacter cellulosilyticus]|uniref:Nuclear transport factor 2 family protein n=1 Tax=Hymenobacter cellulosilyticus TaxID=2932248 RepID=A0A8T9Q562_9BACT|nr:nuclear transport factor 2 family protein [Hymenobacter cellulosilyticus]UOQ71048.1 nuclear transport factor 2 family protein [Hymenobacter cellulosilyticus]